MLLIFYFLGFVITVGLATVLSQDNSREGIFEVGVIWPVAWVLLLALCFILGSLVIGDMIGGLIVRGKKVLTKKERPR